MSTIKFKTLVEMNICMRNVEQLDEQHHLVKIRSNSEEDDTISVVRALNMAHDMKLISQRYAAAYSALMKHIENAPHIKFDKCQDVMCKVLTYEVKEEGHVWVRLRDLYMWGEGTTGIAEFGSGPIAMRAIEEAQLR